MNANSDHRPLSFRFKLTLPKTDRKNAHREKCMKYIWDPTRKNDYHKALDSAKSKELYTDFMCSTGDRGSSHSDVISNFNDYLISAIRPTFKISCPRNQTNTFPCNEWFDDQCKALKSELNTAIQQQAPYHEQCLSRQKYKQVVQAKKRKYQAQQATKLRDLCNEKPNIFWRYWKKLHSNTPPNDCIDIDTFTSHYKQSNKPLTDTHFENTFMENLTKRMDEFGDGETVICPDPINDILNGPILIEEIHNALKHSKYKKRVVLMA